MPASTCCRRTPHDLPNHKSEFGKSPIERVGNIDIQHDPSGQPQCALRLSEPVKSSLYPSALRRVKRTHAANQMKRVQRVEDSLAQVWGRAAPNGLPAENITKPMRSRKNALCRAADSVPRVPFVLRRDRHKETHKPEVNPQSPITAPTIRERTNGDHDPRRNRNGTSRKPSCLALCGKQQA